MQFRDGPYHDSIHTIAEGAGDEMVIARRTRSDKGNVRQEGRYTKKGDSMTEHGEEIWVWRGWLDVEIFP